MASHPYIHADLEVDAQILADAEAEARRVRIPTFRNPRQVVMIAYYVSTLPIVLYVPYLLRSNRDWAWIAAPLLVGMLGIGGLVHGWITRRERARRFRVALNRRGVPVCIQCGYSLQGLSNVGQQCPECGAMRETHPSASR